VAFDFTLCADDYGMTEGVSRGILEAAAAGRLSAASAMTNMPDWPRAAGAWRAAAPPATLGLHLNLTLGTPLGAMGRIAPSGSLPAIGTLLRTRDLPGVELEAEIERQIEAFEQAFGRRPAHVDGHQHVHVVPGVRNAIIAVLRRRGAGMPLRDSTDALWRIALRRRFAVKAVTVALAGRGFGSSVRAAGFVCNEGFAGFSSFDPRADMSAQFASYLVAPGPRHLVMCHPGRVDAALRALDPVTESREAELAFLLSSRFADLLGAGQARLAFA
jgi:predicted glycoside hydrolase/deacetylase ChbG (UPF0249 family)